MCSLIADELRSRGKHVVSLSMLGYSPSSHSLEEFWKIKTSRSYFDWFNHVSELYVLVDELQMTYPLRKEEIVDTYQLKNESAILAPEQHHHFFECAKVAMQNHTVKLIAFSSLGSSKIGGLLPTPINFGHSGQHYNFLENEVHELLSNFARRTQIKFISDGQVAPDFLRGFLESETNYHIGYCAAILHTINMFFLKINNEQEFKAFLYSKIYYTNLRAYRPLPSFYSINADERKALIEFWYKKEDAMSDHYTNLVKRGWIGLNSATSQVYLYCPLYRDLLMMELFCSPRPKIDQLKDVGEFMQTFLARLQRKDLEANLSKSRDDSILESWWQAEFYRIGCLILGESSTISVEVGPKANIPSGRLDFYINGTRRWAIEFLICGNTPEPEFDNRLEEHVSRFDASEGKYAALEPLEYLVVDFRPRYTPKRQEKKFSDLNHTYYRVWIVLYDNLNFVDLKLIKFSAIGVKTEEIILLY